MSFRDVPKTVAGHDWDPDASDSHPRSPGLCRTAPGAKGVGSGWCPGRTWLGHTVRTTLGICPPGEPHPPPSVALEGFFDASPPPMSQAELQSSPSSGHGAGPGRLWDPSWTSVLLHGQTLVRGQKDMNMAPAGASSLV